MAADASRRAVLALVAGGLCLALAMAASLLARTGALSTAEAWHALTGAATSSSAHLIVWGVRLPRVLAACACGVSLAVSGALLQAALDNDLASPQVMGINAGAGFFALAGTLLFPFSGVARQLMALVGALVSTLMVYLVARRAGAARTTLVLAGVANALSRTGIPALDALMAGCNYLIYIGLLLFCKTCYVQRQGLEPFGLSAEHRPQEVIPLVSEGKDTQRCDNRRGVGKNDPEEDSELPESVDT